MSNKQSLAGFSMIELLIAIGVFTIIAGSLLISVFGGLKLQQKSSENIQAVYYAQEAAEAVEAIRNQGWDQLTLGVYGLNHDSGSWTLAGSSDTYGQMVRCLTRTLGK